MKRIALLVLSVVTSLIFRAETLAAEELIDGIVAVVGDEIILLSELQRQLNAQMMERNLSLEKSPRSELLALRQEVIRGMVDDRLLIEKAMRDSIDVDMREIDMELRTRIANFKKQAGSDEQYQEELEKYGITELQMRHMLSDIIIKDFLKTTLLRDMTRLISVTPQDIEAWFAAQKDSLPEVSERFKLSHILVYPKVSDERKQRTKEKIQKILECVRAGEDFAELAKQYSEDPGNAENGGELPYFTRDEFDPDFTAAAFALQEGEVSGIVETIFGYHIIKVEDIRGNRIRARHILFRMVSDDDDEKQAVERLKQLRDDIISENATFEDMAKKYSEDESSRDLGGKLDWITSDRGMGDSGIPSFILQAQKLKPGEISEPFQSQFGYHIIKLDDHKPAHVFNIKDDRTQVEELIRVKKTLEEYNRIIQKLHDETYIDIRLD